MSEALTTDHAPTQPRYQPSVRLAEARVSTADALRAAAGRLAPVWPLENFVAVNPYLGLADRPFDDAAALLERLAAVRSTMTAAFYLEAVAAGRIEHQDLAAALAYRPEVADDVASLLSAARADTDRTTSPVIPTVARVTAMQTNRDWERLCIDRVSAWAGAYFDGGQALWKSVEHEASPYRSWRAEAEIDRTQDIMGLRGFRKHVRALPNDPYDVVDLALTELGVPSASIVDYLHALGLRTSGWSAYAARVAFESALRNEVNDAPEQLIAIQATWELAIARTFASPDLAARWQEEWNRYHANGPRTRELERRLVLHDALDAAVRRQVTQRLSHRAPASAPATTTRRPQAHAVFCIDVRSEVLRRALETVAPGVETLGFAGFFGAAIEFVPLAHEHGSSQCPVLLAPSSVVAETTGDGTDADVVQARRLKHHVQHAWKSFKMGAISCFSFVGPVGLAYLPKLFADSTGKTRPVATPATEGLPRRVRDRRRPRVADIPTAQAVDICENALRGMSLTHGFAPIVLLVGHGATTVNNPYDAALACGACGGNSGDANARVAAAMLNDENVRSDLAARGIDIPADTWFIGGRHDTTTDEVVIFDRDDVPATHAAYLVDLENAFATASERARRERAARLALDPNQDVAAQVRRRSRDWAQVRPEWGLAGCHAFVAAPRRRTRDVDLGGRVFLHSYDWREDAAFAVLEQIMTAPVIVASWISLQYHASTVDNDRFGSGNKTLHNVVGRVGILEGHAGDLRTGLPWQSVHDGVTYQHDPVRLTVFVEAPLDAIDGVLERHPTLRQLFDNRWMYLRALDDDGVPAHEYRGETGWLPLR